MLHSEEHATCPVLAQPDNYHFEGRCEDCAVADLIRLGLEKVQGRYQAGRLSQNLFEAYMHVWATLSPHGGQRYWRETPQDPDVRRIARKLLRARGLTILSSLLDDAPVREEAA